MTAGSRRANEAPALVIDGLSFAYPDGTRALDEINLVLDAGERVALLGPNGAGKTTLALHLNGILEPASGRIEVGGQTLDRSTVRDIRRRVGLVFQDPDDQLFMPSVAEDVAFGPANLGLHPGEIAARVEAALDEVGASQLAPRPPHHLSTGEKRRVALAGVLAMEPSLLVLDEPGAGLDPAGRRELISLLDDLQMAQLVITHDLLLALELCPRSVVMNAGQLTADGSTAALLADGKLLQANRLELPAGVDIRLLRG